MDDIETSDDAMRWTPEPPPVRSTTDRDWRELVLHDMAAYGVSYVVVLPEQSDT